MAEEAGEQFEAVMAKYQESNNDSTNGTLRFLVDGQRLDPQMTVAELKQELGGFLNRDGCIEIDVSGQLTGGAPDDSESSSAKKLRVSKIKEEVLTPIQNKKMPKMVKMVFVMPEGDRVPCKFTTEKNLWEATKALCKKKRLDFETTRFFIKTQLVTWQMSVEKVWKAHTEAGEAEIVIDVKTGHQPWVYRAKEEDPAPKSEKTSPEKRNSYTSKPVSFNLTMQGHEPVKITAKENQPLGDVFKEYSEKVNICSGNLRFLWESRLSDTTLVGEIKEEFDRSEDAEDGDDIDIDVHPVLDGGSRTGL